MGRVSDEERAAIEAALRSGQSGGATARAFGRSISTIVGIAKRAGIALDQSATKKAVAARIDYAQAERIDLLNELFGTARSMIRAGGLKPGELQQVSMAVAIMIDKRRLEDGEATSRSEVHDSGTQSRLAGRLDELAARRAARRDHDLERTGS